MLVISSAAWPSAAPADGVCNPSKNAAAVAVGTALAAQAGDAAATFCHHVGMTYSRGRLIAEIEFLSVHIDRLLAPVQPDGLGSGKR